MIPKVRAADWPHAKPIEFIQRPGEIVYVPGGWHHVVINVDDTVAVTQNFCSYVDGTGLAVCQRMGRAS